MAVVIRSYSDNKTHIVDGTKRQTMCGHTRLKDTGGNEVPTCPDCIGRAAWLAHEAHFVFLWRRRNALLENEASSRIELMLKRLHLKTED